MENKVYNFDLTVDWKLMGLISEIDRFDAGWTTIERKIGSTLKELKGMATVRSVGASNRIEGNKMSDVEVDELLQQLNQTSLTERDTQEVAGYFEVMDLISASYENMANTETQIRDLHNRLMKYSTKDAWHKGNYKMHNNAVEATFADGNKQLIFKTTEAGIATEDAMRSLLDWYKTEQEVHPLVKIAAFVYDFLSIHPFQDGNGRLSRLMTTWLLLQSGYKWVEYVSFEHEIENRKNEYYQVLRACQAQRPNEEITVWVQFFLGALRSIQVQLQSKLERSGLDAEFSSREKDIYAIIHNQPHIKSGEIAEKTGIPASTVKRILADLSKKGLLEKHGVGRGISYTVK